MNCNTTHYRANSSSVPGDPTLCLGHKADVIKDYFLHYDECVTNDFVLRGGKRDPQLLSTDIDSWSITFVDTGIESNIGMRLAAVREHLAGEEVFLANYSDNLTDAPLPTMIEHHRASNKIASFISVCPSQSFHVVRTAPDASVQEILPARDCDLRINGGFFVLKQSIFDYMRPGEELVIEPFQRLIAERQLTAYRHDGFWACMDTFKEKQVLEDLHTKGSPPWQVWKNPAKASAARSA